MLHCRFRSPDHQAVAALKAPDPAAGTGVHIGDAFGFKLAGAPDIVHVVGVAAVDDDVAGLKAGHKAAMVASTAAAGTISHTARGRSSFRTMSSSDEAPVAPSCASASTGPGVLLDTTH